MDLQIVADENIPAVQEAFGALGKVELLPGRGIRPSHLRRADVLLVRSVTPVNKKLLHQSRIKMIASATIGTDHVDLDYLSHRGIGFAHAAGANANSVAEYVMAALLELALAHRMKLSELSMGVVGVGHIGSIVARMADGLGITVLLNDPPLYRRTRDPSFLALDQLMEADIISLHVPLTFSGPDRTFHLFDKLRFEKMKPGSILINTSRGAVVDTPALKWALKSGHLRDAVLDVWENEPDIDLNLLQEVEIGTPHIAGYSYDGKLQGTYQIYSAVCRFFGIEPQWKPQPLASPQHRLISRTNSGGKIEESLAWCVRQAYDIRFDDQELKRILGHKNLNPGGWFDGLRKDYPIRWEFSHYKLQTDRGDHTLRARAKVLGFAVEEDRDRVDFRGNNGSKREQE